MATDIQPVMPIGGGDGLGGGFGGIIFFFAIIALLMFGGGGLTGNNGNSNAIQNDINRGFDSQNLQAQTRDILGAVNAGTAQAVAATNQSFHDNLVAMQSMYNETARDIAALAVGQAQALANQNECCCATKQLIMQSNYDGAMRDAATNANFTAQIQSVKDLFYQQRDQMQQARIQSLELQQAMTGVLKFPMGWTYAGGYFPPLAPTTGGTTT